jgi:tetratricopeptide (TPR) repeat protein
MVLLVEIYSLDNEYEKALHYLVLIEEIARDDLAKVPILVRKAVVYGMELDLDASKIEIANAKQILEANGKQNTDEYQKICKLELVLSVAMGTTVESSQLETILSTAETLYGVGSLQYASAKMLIANQQFLLHDYSAALENIEQAQVIYEGKPNTRSSELESCYSLKAGILLGLGEYQEALVSVNLSLNLVVKNNGVNGYFAYNSYMTKGGILINLKDYDAAIAAFKNAEKCIRNHGITNDILQEQLNNAIKLQELTEQLKGSTSVSIPLG